ncbi:LPXTG cell wall anchor domain-containing protein [Listeria cossartiae]|uniref:LPXTG cell wall anchor domain-containing protein n=1 Tax=Listeria cossartiae TaxID=2838249 RepID=UPI001E34E4F6|nr:LPXTG cell wall anchor domain-containing protein [Listeria cossartiae]MCD2224730.1 LPXTG cell wall anchor domain-containing protein [Listeria cossartiae]MCD2239210.1 LPXTG cell wall anchor domain-containing protein [Listeria cossartiae]
MKKMGFILICCLFVCASPFYVKANTDKATSKAGVIFTHDPRKQNTGTDDRSGTFPTKFPPKKLPKTGDTTDLYFILLGISCILIARNGYFKEVRKEIR